MLVLYIFALLSGVIAIEVFDQAMPYGADKYQRRLIEFGLAAVCAALCIGTALW